MVVVIAGCGWLGTALGRALVEDGVRVVGVRRSPEAARSLETAGIEGVAVDLASPGFGDVLPERVDAVVACQAPSDRSVEGYRTAYVDTTRSLLEWAARVGARSTVYTGSTGVFGQSDGSVVDESTTPVIASPNAEVLAEAERLILSETGARASARLVRLSGLYGPDRIGVLDRVRRGALALGPGDDAWMNWCHLDDAVGVVRAALERGRVGSVYHGSDALPARRWDVVRWIAERLGVEPVRRDGATDEAADRPRRSNRRISGERTRSELGVELRYPSFRDGLAPLIT